MNKIYTLFFILLFFSFGKLLGQNNFTDTSGDINVDGGGQLQYTLPIALPPSIKSVAPQISITYSSHSSNGIAGYGWNISGITNISRSGKNLDKDGNVEGIELNYNDFYSFNGQRLILISGEYGKDGAIYNTEKFSNIKIKSVGTLTGKDWLGPNYFEVTFEDGSQAWYGSTNTSDNNASTPIEYNIVKWKDVQGNYITYEYTRSNNVSLINKISWGGNEILGKSHFNSLIFNYKNRNEVETSYLNGNNKGISFVQTKVLSNIIVNSNNTQFKKYVLEHINSGGSMYEVVRSITEYNAINEAANPVEFTYENYILKDWSGNRIIDSAHKSSYQSLYGDFDGDGEVDLIVNEDKKIYLYKKVFYPGSAKVLVSDLSNLNSVSFSNAIVAKIKNNNNQIIPRSSIILLEQAPINSYNVRNLTIRGYILNPSTTQLELQFEKILAGSTYDGMYTETTPGGQILEVSSHIGDVREIDVDGDGLSELYIQVVNKYCRRGRPIEERGCDDDRYSSYIVDFKSDNINGAVGYAVNNLFSDYIQGDFNGDGIIDFLKIKAENTSQLITFVKNGTKYNSKSSLFSQTITGITESTVVGDFNGDGKSDLLIPKVDKSSDWLLYLSNGKGFQAPETKVGLVYYSKDYKLISQKTHNKAFESGCVYSTIEYNNNFFASDLNNDGRDELIANKLTLNDHEWSAHWDEESTKVEVNVYTTTNDSNGILKFNLLSSNIGEYPNVVIPFNINTIYKGGNNTVIIGKPNDCSKTDCETFFYKIIGGFNDLSSMRRLNKINQGGINTTIIYKELDPVKNPNFYKGDILAYPFIGSERVPGSFAVAQLQQDDRKQDFYYQNMVMNVKGSGVGGFQRQARSSWYANGFENTKIWSVSEMDPYNGGVTKKEWNVRVSNNDINRIFTSNLTKSNSDLISYTETEYLFNYFTPNGSVLTTKPTTPTPNLITAIVPNKTTSFDPYQNVTSVETITYNKFYLPVSTTSNINNGVGSTVTTLNYLDNANGNGRDYYIGRPLSKTVTVNAYGKSISSKEEYVYSNDLVSAKKTYNRDESEFITESYIYDGFGNITQKTVVSSVDSTPRTIKTEYDPQGKFVLKTTDNLELTTTYTYNNWGQLLTEIDVFGNTTTNTYDSWGRQLTSKHNLLGTSTFSYEKDTNRNIKITVLSPTGNSTSTFTNKLGQEYKTTTKGFNTNKFISKEIQYDALGRKIKESEPYYEGETIKWNTISYNDAVYPQEVISTSFTGKQVKAKQTGRVKSLIELNGYARTTTQEFDVLGNIIKSTDPGGTIEFAYDPDGQQISAKYDTNIVITKYDKWGKKSEFNDPSNGLYKYYYNAFGNPIRIESPKGKKEFTYNTKGQLITQVEIANDSSTSKNITFTYNAKGQLIKKEGTAKNAKNTSDTYVVTNTYATNGRLTIAKEVSNEREFEQNNIVYNDKGLITSYTKQVKSNNVITKADLENVYHSWSGIAYQLKDKNTGTILWQLDETKANGQVVKTSLGKTSIVNTYDDNNMLSSISHVNTNNATILKINYSFNAIKNELNSRKTLGDFSINETFTYDNNNRLTNWTNPTNGSMHFNVYDVKGRITENNQLGRINFAGAGKVYQPISIDLNQLGSDRYQNDLIQTISYNENNDPVFIDGTKGDASFSYGLTNMRQKVSYGGNFKQNTDGKFTKIYDESGSVEIIINNQTGAEKHILYIGGTPYDANIILVKDYNTSTANYHFLHKDYIGSILAITDQNGVKKEQRHFDAWGNITHLKQGNNATITDVDVITQTTLFLDRGYTSHEHFQELGIIHMNGRLYDPILRRFLNADENIQDPMNTQNYNKYGYVFNNPLMFNDPNGEFAFAFLGAWFAMKAIWATVVTAAIIGAGVGVISYSLSVAISGQKWNIGGALKGMMWGAISGAVTAGIGNAFTPAAGQYLTTFGHIVKGGAHAIAQSTLSIMQGGNFYQAFVSAAVGSLAASGWSNISGKFTNSTVGMITFAAVSGGVGSSLVGGNFWEGFVIGGTVAGLNDALHKWYQSKSTDDRLHNLGLNPKDTPNLDMEEVDYLLRYDELLKEMNENANNPDITIDRTESDNASIKGSSINRTVEVINLGVSAFRNYRQLFNTLGHELYHANQYVSGRAYFLVKKFGLKRATDLFEYEAHHWNSKLNIIDQQYFFKKNIYFFNSKSFF